VENTTEHRAGMPDALAQHPGNDDEQLEWYWVSALFKAVHIGSSRKRHLWERTVFLVRATSGPKATDIAEKVARGKEEEYLAAGGDKVRWVFQEIEKIQPLVDERFEDGTEVYWEFFERVDGAAKIRKRREEPHGPRAQ
jgi:hypothetical protein